MRLIKRDKKHALLSSTRAVSMIRYTRKDVSFIINPVETCIAGDDKRESASPHVGSSIGRNLSG